MTPPRDSTKEERRELHREKMRNKRGRRARWHAEYLKSPRAKKVAQWAAWVRTHWHKSIWPAAKVERRRAAANG